MAVFTAIDPDFNGVTATPTAVGASNTFANSGKEFLQITNGGATGLTVTVVSPVKCNHGFTHDITVTISAGATKMIGEFPTARFNNSSGVVTFNCSATTSVTALVLKAN